ncbi:hypothetical protein FM106_25910 [Brachybacterium faecium]|nr:hypothetical protein FM106_25910 [Brachybacterium faecium]
MLSSPCARSCPFARSCRRLRTDHRLPVTADGPRARIRSDPGPRASAPRWRQSR